MPDNFEIKPVPGGEGSQYPPAGANQSNNIFDKKTVQALDHRIPAEPFMARVKGFYASNKIYVWGALLAVFTIVLLAFFAFRPGSDAPLTEAKIDLVIEAPETVPSGGEAVYKIKVENKDNRELAQLQLELTYPSGVSYVSSSPKAKNMSGTLYDVPNLKPGQNVVLMVKTKVTGSVNDSKELRAQLNYRYLNFSSDFSKEQRYSIRLVSSDAVVEITGPQTTANAQVVTYTVKYKNNSKDALKNARVQATYPEGFSFADSQPKASLGGNVWNIGSLEAGGQGEIAIHGSYGSAQPGESKTIKIDFQILGNNGEYFTQAESTFVTALSSLPLLVSQELSGNSSGVVKPGDDLTVTVKFQNNAAIAARGVNIEVTLDSIALDMGSLRSEGGLVSSNTISWNAASLAKLENLNPGESGQVSFAVRVRDPATRDSSKNLSVISSIKIKSNEHSTFFPGNQLSLKVATVPAIASQLSFVSGSLPPRVGTPTVYKVRLSLRNATNDLSNASVTAFIPLGAGGFEQGSVTPSESGKVSFDPSTGKLTWEVGNVPAHSGSFSAPRTLEFNVRLQPSSSQVGSSPVLVRNIRFAGTDTYTNQDIELDGGEIQTSDINVEDGFSKGQVVQ